jgi:microcystin-dependent protein
MRDWTDSVPFIKEVADKAQLGRAGLAKTTTDEKINNGDNTDQSGVSPLGFITFVKPAQIPVMIDSASVTWNKVSRGGATNTDTGVGIEDWEATVSIPAVPENTDDIVLVDNYTINSPDSTDVCDDTQNIVNVNIGDTSTLLLDNIVSAINAINAKISTLSNAACSLAEAGINLGDVMLSYSPPATWSSYWLEPKGQLLSVVSYPELYAIFGTTYGGVAGVNFNLPNLTDNKNYLRAYQGAGLIAPANVHGGLQDYTLVENDIPEHSHSLTTTATGGEHFHTYRASDIESLNTTTGCDQQSFAMGSNVDFSVCVDGDAIKDAAYGPTGSHTHNISGTTDSFGGNPNDPVWNMSAIDKTPAYTNFYLKMRVK